VFAGKPLRAVVPEIVVFAGCVVAFAGNYALLAWTILATPPDSWALPALLTGSGMGLAAIIAWALARSLRHTAKHFAILGVLATPIVLLTVPGLIGGGIALAGATFGILARYGVPVRAAS